VEPKPVVAELKRKRSYGGRRAYDMRWRKWLERIFVIIGAAIAALPGIDYYEKQAMQRVLFQVEQARVKELELKLKAMQSQLDSAREKDNEK